MAIDDDKNMDKVNQFTVDERSILITGINNELDELHCEGEMHKMIKEMIKHRWS